MLSLEKNLQPVDFGFRDKTRPMKHVKDYLRFLSRSTVLRKTLKCKPKRLAGTLSRGKIPVCNYPRELTVTKRACS